MSDVKVYSTPTCPYCKKAKEWLDSNGIKYENIDVSSNAKYADEMIKKSGQRGVPVIDIDGKIIVGYDIGEMKKSLGMS